MILVAQSFLGSNTMAKCSLAVLVLIILGAFTRERFSALDAPALISVLWTLQFIFKFSTVMHR